MSDPPLSYISVRITDIHANWDKIKPICDHFNAYISYPHYGDNKDNEHFHVFIPDFVGTDKSLKSLEDKFRNRVKSSGYYGNGKYSVKRLQNGITQAISYGAREKTVPHTKGEHVDEWIAAAPEWVERDKLPVKRKRTAEADEFGIKITCVNVIKRCFDYHARKNMKTDDMKTVLHHMLQDGYYMDANVMRSGLPEFFLDVFKESVAVGKLTWSTSTLTNIFRTPRQTW